MQSKATIRGSLVYCNRKYKYSADIQDTWETSDDRFIITITNPVGDHRRATWHFKKEGIEQAVIRYILSQKRAYSPM